jgi:CrcB protein
LLKYILIAAGGGTGALARYLVGTAIMERFGGRFPLGTVLINISGSFLIGLLMTLFTGSLRFDPNLRLFLVVGVLGGYTTFSSFEWETFTSVREGGYWIAFLNVVGSVALGFVAVWIGAMLAPRR